MSTSFEPENTLLADVEIKPLEVTDTAMGENLRKRGGMLKRMQEGGMFAPFKVRNFSLLFGGQTISTVGDALYAVALPWLILNNGGNAQELGIVLTAFGIPRMFSILLGGWLSDLLRPRKIMLIADAARTILMAIMAALVIWNHPTLWQLCIISVLLGAFGGAFLAASSAILPDLLPDEKLQAGNALNLSSTQAANLVGSALAGVFVATLTAGFSLALDALTFVISAVTLFLIRTAAQPQKQPVDAAAAEATTPVSENATTQAQITFWHFMRNSRLFQVGLVFSIVANFCFGGLLEVTLPALVHGPMNGGAGGFGVILAGFGAGALVGGIFAGMLDKISHKGLVALLVAIVQGLSLAILPYGGVVGAVACMFICGLSNSITNVLLITVLQRAIPRHLMGRIMGLLMFTAFGSYPISVALAGVLTTNVGPAILFPYSGALLILAILFGIAQKEIREL